MNTPITVRELKALLENYDDNSNIILDHIDYLEEFAKDTPCEIVFTDHDLIMVVTK